MQIHVDERTYLTLLRVAGRVTAEGRHKLWQTIDEVFRTDPVAVVWDLGELEELHDHPLAVLVGWITYQRLRRDPVVMIASTTELTDRLRSTGLLFDVSMVADEQEACLSLLDRIPTKYDEFFCKVVVDAGLLEPGRLKNALMMYEKEGRAGDFGRLLLREGHLTAPELLEAVFRQKTLLGDILVESGKLTPNELEMALGASRAEGEKLGDLLLRLGLASNEDIYDALKAQFKKRLRFRSPEDGKSKAEDSLPKASRSARLGEILLEKRLLSQEDLDRSLQLQRQTQGREKLGDILVRLGFVDDSELYTALLTQYERSQASGEVSGEVRAALEALIQRLGSGDYLAARHAHEGLLALGGAAASVVAAALRSPSPPVRRGAADVLGAGMVFGALPQLLERLEDPIPRVRQEVYWALLRISAQGFAMKDTSAWHQWWSGVDPSTLPPPPETISAHREEMARMLATAIEEGRALDAFDIEYRGGQAEWEGGHVRLTLRGDGLVQVFHVQRGETATYLGSLDAGETRQAFASFSGAGILFIDTNRSQDDSAESRHELALRIGNRYYRRSVLYYRELFQNWSYRSYETQIRDLVRRVTRGAVL
jgi:hypothetical protein